MGNFFSSGVIQKTKAYTVSRKHKFNIKNHENKYAGKKDFKKCLHFVLVADEVGHLKQFCADTYSLIADFELAHNSSIWCISITSDGKFSYTADQAGI